MQEGFVLLTLPDCTILASASGRSFTGDLELDCVTVNESLVLVLRLDGLEYPVDPTNPIYRQHELSISGSKAYTFLTASDGEILLTVTPPNDANEMQYFTEDIQTFESILSQYAEFRDNKKATQPALKSTNRPVPPPPINGPSPTSSLHVPPPAHPAQMRGLSPPQASRSITAPPTHPTHVADPHDNVLPILNSSELQDYKGQLVLVNEDNGHVVGQFDNNLHITADPTLMQRGHEKDPVIIEVKADEGEESARECFIRAIPPEEHDWMTKGATVASYAITAGASIIATTISAASSLYIKHSKPSPSHTAFPAPATRAISGPSAVSGNYAHEDKPKPPRFVTMLTSPETRKNMHRIHVASGKAVKLSTKTMGVVDDIVKKAAGRPPKKTQHAPQAPYPQQIPGPGPQFYPNYPSPAPSPQSYPNYPSPSPSQITRMPSPSPPGSYYTPPRGSSPQPSTLPPPPYPEKHHTSQTNLPYAPYQGTPRQSSPSYPPIPQAPPSAPPALPQRSKLSGPKRLLLSANLILDSIDESGKKLLDVSGRELSGVMNHKYGKEAAESTTMITESVRNAALVYVDMRGLGRRALIKRVGKEYVRGKFHKD